MASSAARGFKEAEETFVLVTGTNRYVLSFDMISLLSLTFIAHKWSRFLRLLSSDRRVPNDAVSYPITNSDLHHAKLKKEC